MYPMTVTIINNVKYVLIKINIILLILTVLQTRGNSHLIRNDKLTWYFLYILKK